MNFRDVELLSTYLDGQLNPSDSARLESRLKTDPELAAVMDDLRAARSALRQLPNRRAPRNFTLTPKMVGVKPPLPRAYPIFRFASVFAALLFFLSYATNLVAPRLSAASAPYGYGVGGGGGGCGDEQPCEAAPALEMPAAPQPFAATEAPVATEAPMGTEAPALAVTEAPAGTASLAIAPTQMAIAPTEMPLTAEDSARVVETPSAKNGEPESTNGIPPEVQNEAPVSYIWLIGFAVVAVLSALVAYLLRLSAIRKWRRRVG
jgi:anti-sigma factor RsiW